MAEISFPKAHKNAAGQYLVYIGGEWVESPAKEWHPNINPADTAEVLGQVPECTPAEVEQAMRAAQAAFPAWRAISGAVKTKMFLRAAAILEENKDALIRLMTREMGKTLFDSRLDVEEAIGVLEVVGPQGASLKGETYQTNLPGVVMESRVEPRGVAAIITPFNFPMAIPVAQLCAALVTGNTVVWKPSHLVPECSQALADALLQAMEEVAAKYKVALPPGVFNLLLGDVKTGEAVVHHPIPMALSFTGSKVVGDKVDSIASGLGKRVMKEVGGINLFYVHRQADLPRAVRNFLYGKTITGGQRCTSVQEVLADAEIYEEFKNAAIAAAANVVVGDGASAELAAADADPDEFSLPPLVSKEQYERLSGLVKKSLSQGARILYQAGLDPALAKRGCYYPLTFLENVNEENALFREEAFGPVAVFTPVPGINEAIDLINRKIGIVACIDSQDKDATEHFIQNVLRTRVDDGRHGTGAFWATKFGGDRGAGSGNPALEESMAYGYVLWKTIYRAYKIK